MPSAEEKKMWRTGASSGLGLLLLVFLTAASQQPTDSNAGSTEPAPNTSDTSSLEEELKSFEAQLGTASSAESLFANGRAPDLVVISSTDVHGEIEPCG
jgi:hypothetical protein